MAEPKPSEFDTVDRVVEHIAKIGYDDLPEDVVDATKRFILDALSATIAGSSADGVAELVSLLAYWGGRPESTIAFYGEKLPSHLAVIANVTMCHALEIDDGHYPGNVHPTAPTLWAGLTTAEAIGGISGKELLTAVAVGVDLMVRIGLAAPRTWDYGHHTAVFSAIGAATVAGKLRNASLPVLKNALGITLSQMSATVQAAKDAALVKRMQPGFNASDGMRSVELAERGIMGTANVFDGEFGLFRLFNRSSCNRGILLHELGRKFHGQDLSIKRYPASRCSHAPIEGTIDLVNKHNLKPEQIKSIVVEVAEGCRREAGDPYDLDKGWPQVNAQFNIPFGVAAAALWRDVFIEQVQNKATRDPELLKMAARVEVKARADTGEPTAYLPSTVTIRTIDGTEYRTIVSKLRGSPDLPLSWDEIVQERTMRCAQWGRRRLDAVQLSEIIEAAKNLEQLPDARQLLRHLT